MPLITFTTGAMLSLPLLFLGGLDVEAGTYADGHAHGPEDVELVYPAAFMPQSCSRLTVPAATDFEGCCTHIPWG